MKIRIRINGFLMLISIIAMISLYKFTMPDWKSNIIDELLDIFGLILLVFGQTIRVCARGYKADISSDGSILITDGPYAFVRNPMYLGIFFIGLGAILLLLKWWMFFFFLFLFLFRFWPQISKEERRLSERFGNKYSAYCKSVPKLFPVFSKWAVFCWLLPFKWRWLKKEMVSIGVTILIMLVIEAYEDIRLFGGLQLLKELFLFVSVFMTFILFFYFLSITNKIDLNKPGL